MAKRIKGIKPPRRFGRPIGKKWDKAKLISLDIPNVLPFAMEKGYVGSYFLWVISGRKWVYVKKPQSTKIETPKQLRLKIADWEKIIKFISKNTIIVIGLVQDIYCFI